MADIFVRHQSGDSRLSTALWGDCPLTSIRQDPNRGFIIEDDFNDLPTGKYTATQATTGTFALGDGEGGVVLADCNSATATQGINVQLGGTAGESVKPAANRRIWFEAYIMAEDIATGPEFFLGLSETDTTIIGSSANTSANHIGWESVTDDNVLLFYGEKAGARNTGLASHTFVDGEWVRLGFKVDRLNRVYHYVNGVLQSTSLTATNIPIVEMRPSLVCQSGGTTDPIVYADIYRCVVAFD